MLLQLEVSMRGCSGLIQSEILPLCTRTCTLEQVVWGTPLVEGRHLSSWLCLIQLFCDDETAVIILCIALVP